MAYSLASTSLMCMDCKAKEVLYWMLPAMFKEPCGISGPWTLKNCLVCSGEPVKYEKKWHGAELEGIRRSSCISTDTECPEEQQTDKQAIRKDGAIPPAHIYYRHSTGSKWNVSISLSPPSPHHTRIDSFLKGNTFSCTKIPSFFYFQSDCCRTLPVMTETIGELPWNTPPGHWKVFFYLLRDYFKGKSNARNVLSLLTIKQSMEITLIKVNLAWLGHNRRGIY